MQGTESTRFLLRIFLHVKGFSLRLWRKKWGLYLWVTKQDDFEGGEKLLITCSFGNFGLTGIWCNKQKNSFTPFWIPLFNFHFSDRVHDGGSRTCNGWGIQVSKRGEAKKVALLGNFGLLGHWCKEHKPTILPLILPMKNSL